MKKTFIKFVVNLFILINLPLYAQTITTNTTGTHNGFYYTFWSDQSQGTASMTLGTNGNYSTSWNSVGNFYAGKGWGKGRVDRVVCFSGNFNGGSNGYLALYGWSKNDLKEYYICENYGSWTPPGTTATHKGTFVSDGGTYDIYEISRSIHLTVLGAENFKQYWSVRKNKRSSGTITFANHVAAWRNVGMELGNTLDYQIMATEGYQSTGSSNITVSECYSCTTKVPTVAPIITYEKNDLAQPLTATGNNLKWFTTETGVGSNNAPTPNTSTVGITNYYVSATDSCESRRATIKVIVVESAKILKVATPIVIDGVAESVWTQPSVNILNTKSSYFGIPCEAPDLSATAKVLWDNNYLYLLAEVTDDTLKNDSPEAFNDDAVEFYIDIDNDKPTTYGANDIQFSFAWNDGSNVGVFPVGRATIGINYNIINSTNGYTLEAQIPWSLLQTTPLQNQYIGLDFMVNDDDNGANRDTKLYWNAFSSNQNYSNPSLFGTGKLSNDMVVTNQNENVFFESITIYPNPLTNTMQVAGFNGLFTYEIVNNKGVVVIKNNSEGSIDVSKLPTGMYIVKLNQEHVSKTIKFTKL